MDPELSQTVSLSPLDQVKSYHKQTKHEFNQFAKSLGYLDWANQPDPFRRFHGAPLIPLPLLKLDEKPFSPSYEALFGTPSIPSQPVTLQTLSRFFEYALSLTAWKEYNGTSWALRSNPSSGNLHPTEGYAFIGDLPQLLLKPGLYHYGPKEHGLEHRWHVSSETAQLILKDLPTEGFVVGLTSIHWREAWKYGERAFRYCQHDTGHAIGSMRIAAATLGWNMVVLSQTSDDTIEQFLGLHRKQDFQPSEREYPELFAFVWPKNIQPPPQINLAFERPSDQVLLSGEWKGTANRLSKDDPIHWDIIDEVADASWKSTQEAEIIAYSSTSETPNPQVEKESEPLAGQIIHQRRSAVSFDGHTSLSVDRFYTMLLRIMPQSALPVPERPMPWDALPWNPTVHLALFVHRVDGLPSGMYWLNRNPHGRPITDFQSTMHEQFVWATPNNCPPQLPLYLLEEGDAKNLAMQLSCGQEVAKDSAFALGMVAEFDESLETFGPWFYKRLFWETGLIGQVLYLEAEAAGIRSTGIGCFFDDPVHRVLGFHPHTTWQSLYHFTVGGPTDDGRLTTLPPLRPSQVKEPRIKSIPKLLPPLTPPYKGGGNQNLKRHLSICPHKLQNASSLFLPFVRVGLKKAQAGGGELSRNHATTKLHMAQMPGFSDLFLPFVRGGVGGVEFSSMPTKKGNPKLLPLKRRLRNNSTRTEQLLWGKLRQNQIYGLKFRRQHGIGSYIVDFFCPERSLVIEIDGDVHAIEAQQTKDLEREDYLRSLGLQVLRYTNDEVINNIDGVLEDLARRLFRDSTSPKPLLTKEGKKRKPDNHSLLHVDQPFQNLSASPLSREFYDRPTLKVAKELLGKVLVRKATHCTIFTKIVDVEAYVGPKDKACHASKGRTKRTEIMFGQAGFTYVYLIYGMYHLLNIVTEREGYPAAILIRGLEPMEKDDSSTGQARIDGPGRVGRFLELDRTHNGLDTTQGTTIWIEDHGLAVSRKQIQALPRIGVDYAGEWAKKLWRFTLPIPPSPKTRRITIQ